MSPVRMERAIAVNRTESAVVEVVYAAIDDPHNPFKPSVVVTCKETVTDKPFERFAIAVTRQLLGTNANIPLLRELNSLPSYGKFSFSSLSSQ